MRIMLHNACPSPSYMAAMAMLFLLFVLYGCEKKADDGNKDEKDTKGEIDVVTGTNPDAAQFAFASSVTGVPPGWTGPTFKLSHDYPQTLPAGGEDMPWLQIDVDFDNQNPDWESSNWPEYMQAILDYVAEGQDANMSNEIGWQVNVDGATKWFHVPWMAYDPHSGREFIHGATSERVASLGNLVNNDNLHALPTGKGSSRTEPQYETWAFGIYNEIGGYAVGQGWPEDGAPLLDDVGGRLLPKGLPFPTGTCVMKMLFTNANYPVVPYLINSPNWQMDRHIQDGKKFLCQRKPQYSRLVQMDVAVTDPRSPTNWVFGTFGYNGNIKAASPWQRLAPVGIQFGMDTGTFPAVPQAQSADAWQSVLNTNIGIYEHEGCDGRLAGPVDNPESSCMSCHGGSVTAAMDVLNNMGENIPPIFGFTGICSEVNDTSVAYYTTRAYPQPYPQAGYETAMPLDFSLQLQVTFTQYKIFAINGSPSPCSD